MKAKLVLFAICDALLSINVNAKIKDGKAMTGNSLSEFGKYTITNSESPMVYQNKVLETYDLNYENTSNPGKNWRSGRKRNAELLLYVTTSLKSSTPAIAAYLE